MGGCDRSTDIAMATDFWRESAKIIGIPHLHSVCCWHSPMDGRTATWVHALTLSTTPLRLTILVNCVVQ